VFGYSEQYAELRGRPFKGPGKPMHFVGRLPNSSSRRSKPRRMSAAAFAESSQASIDGMPASPTPVPEELSAAFTEAVWRSLPWRDTRWLGRTVTTPPTDLLAYQEMNPAVRPDWVVEIGTGDGGRALFLASVCELVGHGQVLSVDPEARDDRPSHPRLRLLTGDASDESVTTQVRAAVGDGRAIVVLGACADRATTAAQFKAYESLVPVGSYVVVTDTVVNGHPVWPAFGPGPLEAVKQVLSSDGRFVADPTMEKYSLTLNPGGFLRRVS
jgi:cephalosporin hydroxylase